MLPTRSVLFSILFLISSTSTGQQRVGIDISSRMMNLMFTAHYQKVLKNRVLYSVGVFGGANGRSYVENDTLRLYAGTPIASPYSRVNRSISDSTSTYSILDYKTKASTFGLQFGLGYFFEFGVKHGLRTNVNGALGVAYAKTSGIYRSIDNFDEILFIHDIRHFVASISFEAFHTIRLTGRTTFNYGVKVPYYFTVDKAQFNPTTTKDLLYGFEPQLSIGMTYVVGKCD